MKILIAVPTSGIIEPEVFKAIYGIQSDHDLYFDFVRGYDCATARNNIARKAIEGGFDYVLMIDSDTIVPDTALDLMLDPPVDVCLGVCPRKNTTEGKSAMIKWESRDFSENWYYKDLPEGRTRIWAGGFACALIRVSILSVLPEPWFNYPTNEQGGTLSEDFYFCKNANTLGFTVEMDPRVRCGHLARYFQYE